MRILFLGDIVGSSGCDALKKNLPKTIKEKKIDFVIVNGENAAEQGVGITEKICKEMFNSGALEEVQKFIKMKVNKKLKTPQKKV